MGDTPCHNCQPRGNPVVTDEGTPDEPIGHATVIAVLVVAACLMIAAVAVVVM